MVSTEIRIVFLAMTHTKHDPSVTAAEWIELVILRTQERLSTATVRCPLEAGLCALTHYLI